MILFIPYGEDENKGTISERIKGMENILNIKLKLIFLGVGKKFPTFVSSELRLKYHNASRFSSCIFDIHKL